MSRFSSKVNSINFGKPRLFSPAHVRDLTERGTIARQKTANDLKDFNFDSSSSFRYDAPGAGLRSTQQLNVDWSDFACHTFFNSAEVNVNISFNQIIDFYPFDGTRKEIDDFLDSLTGFERYIYDLFPKNKGYLKFENNSYIEVNDYSGLNYPELSRNKKGENVLDPELSSIEFDFHLNLPGVANDNQIVAQKIQDSTYGITLAISQSASTTEADFLFKILSGSSELSVSSSLQKDQFNHIVAQYNRNTGEEKLYLYVNQVLTTTSSNRIEIGTLDFKEASLYIGSGSEVTGLTPVQTLSGSIDEFRVFHAARSKDEITKYSKQNVFASENLKLYFKFNEPTGSLGSSATNQTVLDSSGNSLHSFITNYDASLRNTSSLSSSPLENENLLYNPVLFPAYDQIVSINQELLSSASNYDLVNPNLITKLVPAHYFEEGNAEFGFDDENGTIGDEISEDGIPGQLRLGTAQVLSMFLYVWAKYFDEMKLFHEHFANLLYVDYNKDNNVPDQMLPHIFEYYNIDLPSLFSNSSFEQFINGENYKDGYSLASNSLSNVQNEIWRRILINLPQILKSKGTVDAVKELIRTIGINPDNNFRIREYGGQTERGLEKLRQFKSEVATMLDFSGSISNSTTTDGLGFGTDKPHIISGYLSSSRVEVGSPEPIGTFVNKAEYPPHGISNNQNDGLWTSGSWGIETYFTLPYLTTGSHFVSQSLFRNQVTGAFGGQVANGQGLVSNLIVTSGTIENKSGSIKFYFNPLSGSSITPLQLEITGVNVYDKNQWYAGVSYDNAYPSASIDLYLGRQSYGQLAEFYSTSSLYLQPSINTNVMQLISSEYNSSGSFIVVGSQSIDTDGTDVYFLNKSSLSDNFRWTDFSGKLSNLKFWSKNITEEEAKERTRSFKSLGVENPKLNFGFVTIESGSFEKLRLDITTDQPVTRSNSSGEISLIDFSQNGKNASGAGFEASKEVIKPEQFYFSMISPRIDEATTANKIRVRSLLKQNDIEIKNAEYAPYYELPPAEEPLDDVRFAIDFSIIDALNEDIIKMFATFDELDEALGDPSNLHGADYPDLEVMRDIYFNRLVDKINLKSFFEFFKWFDTSMGMFIEQIIPRKTRFLGINYVIEPHMLERSKFEHKSSEQHLDHANKYFSTTTIVGDIE
jgi:hypothetical protein